jgi:hypothetical protein
MAVSQEVEGLVTFVRDDSKEPLQLFLGEELHLPGATTRFGFWCWFGGRHISDRITVLSDLGKSTVCKHAENRLPQASHFLS